MNFRGVLQPASSSSRSDLRGCFEERLPHPCCPCRDAQRAASGMVAQLATGAHRVACCCRKAPACVSRVMAAGIGRRLSSRVCSDVRTETMPAADKKGEAGARRTGPFCMGCSEGCVYSGGAAIAPPRMCV
ncbi:hypothetical protein MRX96_032199 [Rhipicephalus microplus]